MRSVYSMYTALFSHGFSLCRSMVCKTYLKNTLINTVSKMAYWKKDKNKSSHECIIPWARRQTDSTPTQNRPILSDLSLLSVLLMQLGHQQWIKTLYSYVVWTILHMFTVIVPKAKCSSPVCFIGHQKPV